MSYGSSKSAFATLLLTVILLTSLKVAVAEVMQSGNYQIQSDSINIGGGRSTSTNYTQESTVGEIATGNSTSSNFSLRAGYQQMQEVYIALTGATTTYLSPAIGGISGGTSNGSTTLTVITDSPSGYSLSVAATLSPAMQNGANTLADYSTVGADPDYTFVTDPGEAHFGYTPEGVDVAARFLDNGAACNTGSGNTSLSCWDGLSTSEEVVSEGVGANHPLGATTTINFRVGVGANALPTAGLYFATTTVTAVTL